MMAWGVVARVLRVAGLTLLSGPVLLLAGRTRRPRALRWYFEACGGGLVKVGQLLASRYDLLPAPYCEELGSLFDDLRPVPAAAIRSVVQRDLGGSVGALFASFDDVPLATASLAQVHAAVLPDGDEVVVKVLKPTMRQVFRIDVAILRAAGRVLDALPVLRGMDVRAVVDETARGALAELDLQREARSTAHMHRLMLNDPISHYAPRVHRDYTVGDVLTMERIRGVSVRKLITADDATLIELAARGVTPERTAIILFRSVLEQTIRFRTFNADPHPSNLIVMDGGMLAWVDLGLTGWIDERQWGLQLRLREAFVRGSAHAAYLAMLESIEPIPQNRDLRGFEQELKEGVRDYLLANEDPGAPLTERSAGVFLVRMLQALRRSRLPATPSTVALYRTILVADMVVLRLYPSIDWIGHLRRFVHDYAPDAIREAAADQFTASAALQLARAPRTLAQTLGWLSNRLPELGRSTLRTFSLFERMVLTGLRAVRAVTVIVATLLAWATIADPDSGVARTAGRVSAWAGGPWFGLAACVIVVLVTSTLVRRAES